VRHAAQNPKGAGPYWALRVTETVLLVAALVGIGLFAWSLVDIVRIETAAGAATTTAATRDLPAGAWPGIFVFLGSMIALQAVRVVLHRYRRDDGSARGDERSAKAATADALLEATVPFEPVKPDEDATTGA
jgi:TRAP-type C4-dicarboxylate transport system permease small subunit